MKKGFITFLLVVVIACCVYLLIANNSKTTDKEDFEEIETIDKEVVIEEAQPAAEEQHAYQTRQNKKAVKKNNISADRTPQEALPAAEEMPENDAHLCFKNVPIDGTLSLFVKRMEQNGFQKRRMSQSQAMLEGDFAGFKDCIVYVSTLDNKDLVSKITVLFPDQEQWSALYGDYKQLKEMLTTKYGKPASCVEKFQDSHGSMDDGDKMFAVKFDRCRYETLFSTNKGNILLRISHEGASNTYVTLTYSDKINSTAVKQHAINDL